MDTTIKEVLQFAVENDVKFIRLAFCDIFGTQKNISIMANKLEEAFENGISIDGSAINGFETVDHSDLFLVPDPSTLAVLPWRPQQGRVIRFYCNIKRPDGSNYSCDSRRILQNIVEKYHKSGYVCNVGAECEFYLFRTDEQGEPTTVPFDNGGYLDISPLDKGENVRREICFSLEDMGVSPESSHHEQGPGQNEIDFRFSDAVSSADNLLTFKSAVKIIAARNGLYASFLPKPILEKSGNGLHINLSLSQNGFNIFKNGPQEHNKVAESFIAGILAKSAEMSVIINPVPNSYYRIGSCEAPKYVTWSHGNRSQLIRIPASKGEGVRMELRSPDPSANPYLAYSVILGAGLYGIENNLALPAPTERNLYEVDSKEAEGLVKLPTSLAEAVALAEKSEFIRDILGEDTFNKYIAAKKKEAEVYNQCKDKSEIFLQKYFPVY